MSAKVYSEAILKVPVVPGFEAPTNILCARLCAFFADLPFSIYNSLDLGGLCITAL